MSLRTLLALALTGALLASPCAAQPATFWNAIGVTQALKCLRDATVNPLGNHPGLECPPPPKPIADAANLESDNPAIKLAAEIKQQEDLKRQKIKALKYLARTGCGCYPGVAEAFAAATEDCTEDVRMAAAEAIKDASGEVCACCNQDGCCSEDLLKKLAERAYGRDETGCFIEPSDRVREALREALAGCCRGLPPVYEPEESPEPIPEPIEVEPGATDEEIESAPADDGSEYGTLDSAAAAARSFEPRLLTRPNAASAKRMRWVTGEVKEVDPSGTRVIIEHGGGGESVQGAKGELFHQFLLRNEKVGDLRVIAASEGRLVAAARGPAKYLRVGSTVRVQVAAPEPTYDASPSPALVAEAAEPATTPEAETAQPSVEPTIPNPTPAAEDRPTVAAIPTVDPSRVAESPAPLREEEYRIRHLPKIDAKEMVVDQPRSDERRQVVRRSMARRLPEVGEYQPTPYDELAMERDAESLNQAFGKASDTLASRARRLPEVVVSDAPPAVRQSSAVQADTERLTQLFGATPRERGGSETAASHVEAAPAAVAPAISTEAVERPLTRFMREARQNATPTIAR